MADEQNTAPKPPTESEVAIANLKERCKTLEEQVTLLAERAAALETIIEHRTTAEIDAECHQRIDNGDEHFDRLAARVAEVAAFLHRWGFTFKVPK